jgi:hypothetical protein
MSETGERKDRYLIVFLRERLTLALTETPPTEVLHAQGSEYRDIGHGHLTGFYDWLREPAGGLIGVCYLPLRETGFPFELAAGFSYVLTPQSPACLEIYFGPDRGYDPKRSDTQDFGDNWVYRSAEGELAISFGTHWLDESDIERLRQYPVDWIPLP